MADSDRFQNRFYVGGIGGYASTTWYGLVPRQSNANSAMSMSTPIDAQEAGSVWGGMIGFEPIPYFAVEASYMRYPHAVVTFDPMSIFSFENDGLVTFMTHTETVNVSGKAMFFIPQTNLRLFSSAGMAEVHREDFLYKTWKLTPTFGAGANYHFTKTWMGEIAGHYTAGYGESELNPSNNYIPFLYSVTLRMAYFF